MGNRTDNTGRAGARDTYGLTIDAPEYDAQTLHELTGGIFWSDVNQDGTTSEADQWYSDSGDTGVDHQEVAKFAGGGVPGATVEMSTVLGPGQHFGQNNPNSIELDAAGPNDTWYQSMLIRPWERTDQTASFEVEHEDSEGNTDTAISEVVLSDVYWGDHGEHTAAGLAAFARTAHTAWSNNVTDIVLGSGTEPLWRALGYDSNPGTFDTETYNSEDMNALHDAVTAAGMPAPWKKL